MPPTTHPPLADLIAYIWPRRVPCAGCGAPSTQPTSTRGRIQYRRCTVCPATTKALATHAHYRHADPGMPSVIVPIE
jgi:hypothetical protein